MVYFGLVFIFVMNTIGGLFAFSVINKKYLVALNDFSLGLMIACAISSMLMKAYDYHNNYILLISLLIAAIIIFIMEIIGKKDKYFIALTLHNIPEGFIVGLTFMISPLKEAILFMLAIGIQNIPEGFSVSIPYLEEGKGKAIAMNIASGIVEPIAGLIGLFIKSFVISFMPYGYAVAGFLMIFVVIMELKEGFHSFISFLIGFSIMIVMDLIF